MKINLWVMVVALAAGSILAADSDSKADVKNAAKQLGEKNNYSWRTTVTVPEGSGGARFRPGPTDGKTEKDGTTVLKMTRGENSIEAVLKGSKGAIKLPDESWKSLAEAAEDDGGGQPGPGRFIARMLQNYKTPAAEAASLAEKTSSLNKSDDGFSGDLTGDGAKELLTFRRPGGNGPDVSNAKGSVKFWLKDGVLSKYEYHLKGSMNFNGNDIEIDRTTKVEIKDVDETKVNVPEEAKKKL